MSANEILLVYDKECPACNMYCNIVKIREDVGELKIIDAREDSQVRDEITRLGWDIDQGMIVKTGDKLYYGDEAIHVLALMGSRSGVFNRLNYWIFKSPKRSAVLYPILKACRGLLLKLMRKTKINNLGIEGNQRF